MRTHSTLQDLLNKRRVPPDWKAQTANFQSGKPMNSDLEVWQHQMMIEQKRKPTS